MKSFINYYKWHLFFLLIIIICFIFAFTNMTIPIEPDVTIGYIGTNYINVQTFNDNKSEIENVLADANADDKTSAQMYAYTVDLQSEIDEIFVEMVDSGDYDIYISNKEAFESFEDKSQFVTVNEYISDIESDKYETIKDKSGRIYAVSLKDNDYAKKLGILDTADAYIAVAVSDTEDGEEYSTSRKNGKNIALFIVKESIV